MDWTNLDLVVYASKAQVAQGLICLPLDSVLHRAEAARRNGVFVLTADPLAGKAVSTVRMYSGAAR